MSRKSRTSRAEVWRERLERFALGNLSVADFCRRERVSQPSFYQWRKRLRDLEQPAAARKFARSVTKPPGFVSLEVDSALMASRIEIELPGGAVVRLPHDAPAELVSAAVSAACQALSAAEAPSC